MAQSGCCHCEIVHWACLTLPPDHLFEFNVMFVRTPFRATVDEDIAIATLQIEAANRSRF
jgi:hypothetical protein